MTHELLNNSPAPADGARATALAVERAVRAAARAGNRLLAAGTARVLVEHDASRRALLSTLARMGVREARSGSPVDFIFVDGGATTFDAAETVPAAGVRPEAQARLPAVVVGLDGSVASPRGASPAARIDWAERGMPATAVLAQELARGVGAGVGTALVASDRGAASTAPKVAVSLVLEPKTAAFTRTLVTAGCEVAVFSAVSETDPEIARELAGGGQVTVFAPQTHTPEDAVRDVDARHAAGILDWAPDYLIDDGAHLIRLAHTERPRALEQLRGAAEETTSGVRPLREMAAAGALRIPVIAVNDARTKTGFDNLIGTGQSCVFAICDLLDDNRANLPYTGAFGTHWVVVGYGPVGVGTARFAAALGARVTVVEHDSVRALAALHDGFEACGMAEAIRDADVVVSATGVWHTITAAHFAAMRPGTAVAVAGGIDDELALDELRARGWAETVVSPGAPVCSLAEWRAPGAARGPIVLAGGGGINYTAAEGNPIEVMDLSFATQVAALIRLMRERTPPGVHALSAAEETRVARAALAARGGGADPAPEVMRAGGAAQPWPVHRYRTQAGAGETA
ncbi:adenosylhomocysteinase [Leucobacter sp. HY1908]